MRYAEVPYRSELFDFLRGNSDVLERLAVEVYAPGMSSRDVEAADGAAGLIQAVEETWPNSLRLRFWVDGMGNLLAKVPEARKAEVKSHLLALRDAPTAGSRPREAATTFLERFGRGLPPACRRLGQDLEALLAYLGLPWRRRKFKRTTSQLRRGAMAHEDPPLENSYPNWCMRP